MSELKVILCWMSTCSKMSLIISMEMEMQVLHFNTQVVPCECHISFMVNLFFSTQLPFPPLLLATVLRGTYAIVAVCFICPLLLLQKNMKMKHTLTELKNERSPMVATTNNVLTSNVMIWFPLTPGEADGKVNQPLRRKGFLEDDGKIRTWRLTGRLSFPAALDATQR